jgi:hypothetical protein
MLIFKTTFLCLIALTFLPHISQACTAQTLMDMTDNIKFYNNDVATQVDLTIKNITQLCDENLYLAGDQIGQKFVPYEPIRVKNAAAVLVQNLEKMPADMVRGLGLALIEKISLPYQETTATFANTVASFGLKHTYLAKEFAINLLKKKNVSYPEESQSIQYAVDRLMTVIDHGDSSSIGSSIWAFHSSNQSCNYYSGPWGYYYPCPRFYSTVSDNLGNRLILTCKSNESGIQFRVKLGRNVANQLYQAQIESVSFGTNNLSQSMGEVYYIGQDNSLYVTEPISDELLIHLKSDKSLKVNFRINSGEANIQLGFTLKGSNQAISKLIQACH